LYANVARRIIRDGIAHEQCTTTAPTSGGNPADADADVDDVKWQA
jgi:hypothetical protein